MNVLIDTNILVRIADVKNSKRSAILAAVVQLKQQGDSLRVVPQTLFEFWVVATRPPVANGLGKSTPEAAADIATLKSMFTLL